MVGYTQWFIFSRPWAIPVGQLPLGNSRLLEHRGLRRIYPDGDVCSYNTVMYMYIQGRPVNNSKLDLGDSTGNIRMKIFRIFPRQETQREQGRVTG